MCVSVEQHEHELVDISHANATRVIYRTIQ